MYSFLATQSLELALGGAVSANELQVTGCYVDITIATMAMSAITAISAQSNGAGTVTIVADPGAGVVRVLKELTVYNKDTANATVNISYNDNGTVRQVVKAVMPTLYTINYNDNNGWK
jgi:hypothetical protein